MYAIIVGAGKVGRNLARELIAKGHEVTPDLPGSNDDHVHGYASSG